jgi:hypothetical protein
MLTDTQANGNKPYASPKERDLIDALAMRYSEDPKADRVALDNAYASAMGKLHIKYPEDNDVATLYALNTRCLLMRAAFNTQSSKYTVL